ncbi:MAG: DUF222 domain-containing protein [Cellulomonas sp.]
MTGSWGEPAPGSLVEDVPGSVAEDAPASWVEPSAEVVALWAAMDAALSEPVDPGEYARAAAQRLDDFALVELIARLEREASNTRARQLVAIEVLSRRASMNPYWPVQVSEPNVAGEEVAAALGTSRHAGRDLVATARLLAGPLVATGAALEAGQIDWGKAKIITTVLADVAVQVAVDVQARVLPRAGARTPAQLRADLAKALIVVDPHDAEQRTVRAADKRRICHPKVLADGMAGIWAVLPAATATAIDTALSAAAREATHAADPRTTDQLRADTFTHALIGGAGLLGSGLPGPGGPACPTGGVRVDVTVSLATLLGLDDNPGQLAGYGPITAQTARRLATAGTWRRLVTDPVTGTVLDVGTTRYRPPPDLAQLVRARDTRCLSPICSIPAHQCDLDHREPFHPDGTGGPTSAANLGCLCRRDHLLKTHARWRLTTHPDHPGTSTWTTPTGHTYHHRPEPPPGHEPPPGPQTRSDWDAPPPF